jgi:hypothetical protein
MPRLLRVDLGSRKQFRVQPKQLLHLVLKGIHLRKPVTEVAGSLDDRLGDPRRLLPVAVPGEPRRR